MPLGRSVRAVTGLAIAGQFLGLSAAFRYFIMSEGSRAFTGISIGIGLSATVVALAVWSRHISGFRGGLKVAGKFLRFYAMTFSVVAVGFVAWARYSRWRYETIRDSPPKILHIDVLPAAELRALLARPESFQVQATVSAIPAPVRAAFARDAGQESFAMAEPGADWQETDVILKPGLPFYRLGKVAFAGALCILFYERGGIGWSYHTDIFKITPIGATLVWNAYSFQTITGPSDLLTALDSGKLVVESSQ